VPSWPLPEMPQGMSNKLQQLFDEEFNTWGFDVFELSRLSEQRPLLFGGWEALLRSGCFSEFTISSEKVSAFLQQAEGLYMTEQQTPYHNNIHAADVAQTVHALCYDLGIGRFFDPMDYFVAVLSAIVHDLGHDGRNNAYHVSVQDELALTYNDRSVLENYHLSLTFKMLVRDTSTNMLQGLSYAQLAIVRREVIDMVLGTDMSQHFARVGDFSRLVASLGRDAEAWQSEDSHMAVLRSMVLHSADISNPAKPYQLGMQWSFRCLQEFFMQGDSEKLAGVPVSPLCDRVTTDIPDSQIGFIQFIVQPAFEALAGLLPKVQDTCLSIAQGNLKAWEHHSKNGYFYEDTRALKSQVVEEGQFVGRDGFLGSTAGTVKLADICREAMLDGEDLPNAELEIGMAPRSGFWNQPWGCNCR